MNEFSGGLRKRIEEEQQRRKAAEEAEQLKKQQAETAAQETLSAEQRHLKEIHEAAGEVLQFVEEQKITPDAKLILARAESKLLGGYKSVPYTTLRGWRLGHKVIDHSTRGVQGGADESVPNYADLMLTTEGDLVIFRSGESNPKFLAQTITFTGNQRNNDYNFGRVQADTVKTPPLLENFDVEEALVNYVVDHSKE